MKDFIKAINSFAWAVSLYPVQRIVDFLPKKANQTVYTRPPLPSPPTNSHEAVEYYTTRIERSFDNTVQLTFQTGNQIQGLAVDLASGFFKLRTYSPIELLKMNLDLTEAIADTVRQYLPGGANGSELNEPWGWGPVNPP